LGNALYDPVGLFHPMDSGIGKNRIKAPFEGKLLAIHKGHHETALFGRVDLRSAGVDPIDFAARGGNFFGQRSIAAAQVQNHLAGLGI
jgi:hypothetical protein